MKKIALLTCMLSAGLVASALETKSKDPIRVVFSRMDVFYFKVDSRLLGADLEIYSAEGEKLLTQKIVHRKVLVDFYYENRGSYIIKIKKGDVVKEFTYGKKAPSPENAGQLKSITVTQGVRIRD